MPWDPVQLELHEVSAIKAIAASHPVGFAAIVDKLCGADRMSFTAGGEDGRRASDYAEGKRSVGLNLRMLRDMKMPSAASKDGAPPELPNSPTPTA
jgi:hypothetical protein